MKQFKNIMILAVLVILTAIGFTAFAQNASGTALEIFKLGKQSTKVMAALFIPISLYIAAKTLTKV